MFLGQFLKPEKTRELITFILF